MVRVAFDTNLYAYAEGLDDERRGDLARAVIAAHASTDVRVPVQVLAELGSVLVRKGRRDSAEAQEILTRWARLHDPIDLTSSILVQALTLRDRHRIEYWDAVVLASAAEAGCSVLFSEDMNEGFTWKGVTVRSPFPDA